MDWNRMEWNRKEQKRIEKNIKEIEKKGQKGQIDRSIDRWMDRQIDRYRDIDIYIFCLYVQIGLYIYRY